MLSDNKHVPNTQKVVILVKKRLESIVKTKIRQKLASE